MDFTLVGWLLLLGLLILGALVVTFMIAPRIGRSYDDRRERRESQMPRRVCSTCGADLDYLGIQSLQGHEGTLDLEHYRCPVCRKVEFFTPPASLEE